jgi:hypothetical protein
MGNEETERSFQREMPGGSISFGITKPIWIAQPASPSAKQVPADDPIAGQCGYADRPPG